MAEPDPQFAAVFYSNFTKLGVRNRTAAVVRALQLGLIAIDTERRSEAAGMLPPITPDASA